MENLQTNIQVCITHSQSLYRAFKYYTLYTVLRTIKVENVDNAQQLIFWLMSVQIT